MIDPSSLVVVVKACVPVVADPVLVGASVILIIGPTVPPGKVVKIGSAPVLCGSVEVGITGTAPNVIPSTVVAAVGNGMSSPLTNIPSGPMVMTSPPGSVVVMRPPTTAIVLPSTTMKSVVPRMLSILTKYLSDGLADVTIDIAMPQRSSSTSRVELRISRASFKCVMPLEEKKGYIFSSRFLISKRTVIC